MEIETTCAEFAQVQTAGGGTIRFENLAATSTKSEFLGGSSVDKLNEVNIHNARFFFFVSSNQELEPIFLLERYDFRLVMRVNKDESAPSLVPRRKPNFQVVHDARAHACSRKIDMNT